MLPELLAAGYDAGLPVDHFLDMEIAQICWVCRVVVDIWDPDVLRLLRTEAAAVAEALGPLLHRTHVLLVDLVVE